MPRCSQCNATFSTSYDIFEHCQVEQDHHYCRLCVLLFSSADALLQHSRHLHVSCDECLVFFSDEEGLWLHLRSGAHNEVEYPKQKLARPPRVRRPTEISLLPCEKCHQLFAGEKMLKKHREQVHYWCSQCDKYISSAIGLQSHKASPVHLPRDRQCPLCKAMHKVPSSTAQHIESGACCSLNRHQVTTAVHALMIVPTIASQRRIENPTATPLLTDLTGIEDTFNGKAYVCPLCHKKCSSATTLAKHMDSPAHDQKEFQCPKCAREFAVVSALMHHVESKACGLSRLAEVERFADQLTAQFSRALTL